MKIIDEILRKEGSAYTNNPADSGGPTKFGITQKTLSAYRGRSVTPADVAALSEKEAREIYEKLYWHGPNFSKISSALVGEKLADIGVNMGQARAGTFFQRALNGLNAGGKHWPDMVEDGAVGPKTLAAWEAFVRLRGRANAELVMMRYLNGLQLAFYDNLVRTRPKDEEFLYGWILNRVS